MVLRISSGGRRLSRCAVVLGVVGLIIASGAIAAGPARIPDDDLASSPKPDLGQSVPREAVDQAERARPPAVAVVYLVPSDRRPIAGLERALQNTLVHLQRWYAAQMGGGKTFLIADPVVCTATTTHPSSWYAKTPNGNNRKNWFIYNVAADGFKQTGGAWFSSRVISLVYIDAEMDEGQHGGAGSNGGAVLHRMDIEGLTGNSKLPICRWVGGLGHELGHAFGRPHPPECEGSGANPKAPACDTLMFRGMYHYPRTTLDSRDRAALGRHGFFSRVSKTGSIFDCSTVNKIALQAPAASVCKSTTAGSSVPSYICYAGQDGKSVVYGSFDRVAKNRWHEVNPNQSFDWASVSESPELIALFDQSRNLNFEIDLKLNRMRWKVGDSGSWVQSHEVIGHD